MMSGNPNWWSMINSMHPHHDHHEAHQHHQFPSSTSSTFHSPLPLPLPAPHEYNNDNNNLYAGSTSSPLSASNPLPHDHHHSNVQEFPRSWSQLLLGGLASERQERTFVGSPFQNNKLENWEDQILNPSFRVNNPGITVAHDHVKQEGRRSSLLFGGAAHVVDDHDDLIQPSSNRGPSWSQVVQAASSPTSCVTSLSSNKLLNFSSNSKAAEGRNQHPENSSECNSTTAGVVSKKPRIQHSTAQPALKVRKEKLGDRITALHQLVSPFGKTDTASVLSEAIGYIRFLQAQIEALSSPYLGNASGSMGQGGHQQQQSVVQQDRPKDLKSRGLCLVPISCTQHVGSDNGAEYWAPALGGGF